MDRVNRVVRACAGLVIMVLWTALAGPALSQETPPERNAVDPGALALLREAAQRVASADRMHIQLRTRYDVVQADGQKIEVESLDEVSVRRPNRVQATFRRDDGDVRSVYYDGEQMTVFHEAENVYGQFATPDTLDATLDYIELEIGAALPLGDLLYSDLSHLGQAALSGEIVGPSRVGSHDCDHLAFRGEVMDWQIWIERGDARWIRKIVITYKDEPSSPQFAAQFDAWNFDREAPDALFAFNAPDGAEQIPVFARPERGRRQGVR